MMVGDMRLHALLGQALPEGTALRPLLAVLDALPPLSERWIELIEFTVDPGRDSEERLRSILAHIPCGVFWKDHASIYLGCNDRVARDRGLGVAAEVVVVPDSTTGLAKLAYAADLGGNIYRINIGTDNPANWTITKIASLGCSTTASCQANRKFLFAPDVLESNGEYSLLIGSGDREKPLLYYTSASSVKNYFFMLRDKPSDGNWLKAESTTCGAEVICLGSLLAITTSATPSAADLGLKKGWYLGLAPTEQVVTSAITIFGVVTFSTHTPDVPQAGACTAQLGTAPGAGAVG